MLGCRRSLGTECREPVSVTRTFRITQISHAIQSVETNAVRLVLIDGLGGAGKSVLARALAGELRAPLIEGDDFYLPSAKRQPSGLGSYALGASYDWRRLEQQVLAPLARGEDTRFQRYDWTHDRLSDWVRVSAKGSVVVEGVYLLRTELRNYASVSIWVETPRDVRLARGLERDGEVARPQWIDEWMPAEDAYVSAMRPRAAATLVVDGKGDSSIEAGRSVVLLEARPPLDGMLP